MRIHWEWKKVPARALHQWEGVSQREGIAEHVFKERAIIKLTSKNATIWLETNSEISVLKISTRSFTENGYLYLEKCFKIATEIAEIAAEIILS